MTADLSGGQAQTSPGTTLISAGYLPRNLLSLIAHRPRASHRN